MIKRVASTRFSETHPHALRAGRDHLMAAIKCHWPGTGAQKIGSGPLSVEHKLWCVETTQEQRSMSERGRPRLCKPGHADLSRKFCTLGTSSSYLVTLRYYYRRRGSCFDIYHE